MSLPLLVPLLWLALAGGTTPPARAHDLHVSLTRLVFDGTTVACRVRVFHDDLERALQAAAGRPDLRVTDATRADSAFGAYLGRTLRLEADGRAVTLRVTASGIDHDESRQLVVWYILEGELPAPVRRLLIRNALMFELFRDQQNIVQLLRLPGETHRTLYFAATDPSEQRLEFE